MTLPPRRARVVLGSGRDRSGIGAVGDPHQRKGSQSMGVLGWRLLGTGAALAAGAVWPRSSSVPAGSLAAGSGGSGRPRPSPTSRAGRKRCSSRPSPASSSVRRAGRGGAQGSGVLPQVHRPPAGRGPEVLTLAAGGGLPGEGAPGAVVLHPDNGGPAGRRTPRVRGASPRARRAGRAYPLAPSAAYTCAVPVSSTTNVVPAMVSGPLGGQVDDLHPGAHPSSRRP